MPHRDIWHELITPLASTTKNIYAPVLIPCPTNFRVLLVDLQSEILDLPWELDGSAETTEPASNANDLDRSVVINAAIGDGEGGCHLNLAV